MSCTLYYTFMKIYFVSRNSERPRLPPSRPKPLSFTPPNGAAQVLMIPSFTPTTPHSILRSSTKQAMLGARGDALYIIVHLFQTYLAAKRNALDRSFVQKYPAKPTRESFAICKASSSVRNDRIATTGPNVSIFHISASIGTCVKMVGL